MSDVFSGISFGQMFPNAGVPANMSAAQASSGYAGPAAQNQQVVNDLWRSQGGFGNLTNYYSALGANYLARVPTSGENPYQYGGVPASLAYEGATYSGPPRPDTSGSGVFNQSAINNFVTGGGGYSFPGIADFSGGSLPGGTGPKVDFSRIFDMPSVNDFRTGGMAGSGLGGNPALDWTKLFQGGGGGGGMSMPGGLNQPMTTPQQTQAPKTDPYPGMQMPGGLGSPMTAQPKPQQPPIDYGTLFGKSVGGTGVRASGDTSPAIPDSGGPGWQNPPSAPMPDAKRTLGYDPSKVPAASPVGPLPDVGMDPGFWADVIGPGKQQPVAGAGGAPATETGGVGSGALGANATPEQLIQQSRDRLAKLMGPYDQPSLEQFQKGAPAVAETVPLPEARPTEAPNPLEAIKETLDVPLPRERPAAADESPATRAYPGANPPRPSQLVPFTVEPGKEARVAAVHPRLRAAVEGGAQFLPPGYSVEVYSGLRTSGSQGYHRTGNAMDVRIIGPDGRIPSEGEDTTGMYTLLARGVKTWTQQNDPGIADRIGYGGAFGTKIGGGGVPDLMHYDLGGSRGNMRPDVRFGNLQPLSEAERNAMPAYIPLLDANQVPLDGRIPSGPGTRAPVAPMTFGAAAGGQAGAIGKPPTGGAYWNIPKEGTPEWNQQVYEPFSTSVIMRRPENQTVPGASQYRDFRPSENVIDRRTENLGREELAALKARGHGYYPVQPDTTPVTPLGASLGLETLRNTPLGPGGAYRPGEVMRLSGVADEAGGGPDFNATFDAFEPAPSMSDFQSPANNYKTFQAAAPQWQTSIPQARSSPDILNEIYKAAGNTGLDPAVLSQVFSLESGYDPRSTLAGNYGLLQLSESMWADAPFRGTMGGLTFDQFKNATPEQQIAVYADFLNRSGSLTRGGLDPASMSPETQFAYLMANQIGGHNAMGWRDRLAGGDMATPVYTGQGQARELGNLSIGDMEEAYRRRVARW